MSDRPEKTTCRCDEPILLRIPTRGPDWFCRTCGRTVPERWRPTSALDSLTERLDPLSTYADFVAELGPPDTEVSGEALHIPPAGVDARPWVRQSHWSLVDGLSVTLFEYEDGSVRHHVGLELPVDRPPS